MPPGLLPELITHQSHTGASLFNPRSRSTAAVIHSRHSPSVPILMHFVPCEYVDATRSKASNIIWRIKGPKACMPRRCILCPDSRTQNDNLLVRFAVISSVPAPAPAPVLAVPHCSGGLPGAWRCGSGSDSLLFDEATYQVHPVPCMSRRLVDKPQDRAGWRTAIESAAAHLILWV